MGLTEDDRLFLRRWDVVDNFALPPPTYVREFDCPRCDGHASELLSPANDLVWQISYHCSKCTTPKHVTLRDDKRVWLFAKGKGPYIAPHMIKDPVIKRRIVIWRRYLSPSATFGTTYKSLFQALSATPGEDARLGEIQLRQRLDLFGSPVIKAFTKSDFA